MVNEAEPSERLEAILEASLRAAGPTPRFRRQAWRVFQRALDPLAAPKALPPPGRRQDGRAVPSLRLH